MHTQLFLFLICAICPVWLYAQNQPPQITNLSASHGQSQGIVSVTFDLSDQENDDAEILLRASADSGRTFLLAPSNISGDIGYPVSPGNSHTINWDYPDSLASVIENFQVKVIADDRQGVDIQRIVNQVDSQRLQSLLQVIAGVRHFNDGRSHLNEVKDSIEAYFHNYGLQTSRQPFSMQGVGYTGHNIIGRLPGQGAADTTFVIDAHFDGVQGSPGADDNGSATAGFLEAARILSQYNFDHSIRFIGFDQEETGLIGSDAYVNNGGIQNYEHIAGVFNFEMIGFFSEQKNSQSFPNGFNLLFPDAHSQVASDSFRGDFITNVANSQSTSLMNAFDTAAAKYVPNLEVISISVANNGQIAPDLRRSDHANFWDAGINALMLTDGSEFRNPFYHTPNDTIGSLNFTFMANVVKATIGAICEKAGIQHSSSAVTAIGQSTGIEDKQAANMLKLYPNPADQRVHMLIKRSFGSPKQLRLYNNNGQVVQQREDISADEALSIDLEHLPTGMYHLEIISDQQSIVKKLVVE